MVPDVANETAPKHPLLRGVLVLLAVFAGLCTLFALVATAAEAWQENAQARWPLVTARLEKCALDRISTGRRRGVYIDCRLSYVTGTERHVATAYSATAPSPEVWQYPPNQLQPFADWVDEHPPGTPIEVRYDPANRNKVILASDFMPRGGPHTPGNLKLLGVCAVVFLALLTIALITRQRTGKALPLAPTWEQ